MAEDENQANTGGDSRDQKQFGFQRIYLVDSSFESPNVPDVFTQEYKPEFNVNLGNKSDRVDDNTWQVTLTLSIEAKMDDQTVFLAEVQQAGLFTVSGFSKEELHPLLGSYCPAQLYPYAREAATGLIMRGGFPQPMLQPVNFDALYKQHMEEEAARQQQSGQTRETH